MLSTHSTTHPPHSTTHPPLGWLCSRKLPVQGVRTVKFHHLYLPWPPHGLMLQGWEYTSHVSHQAAPPQPSLHTPWQCIGPVQQKGYGCECSWRRERVRRRSLFAVGIAQQQQTSLGVDPPLTREEENDMLTRRGERRIEEDMRPGFLEGGMPLLQT